MSVIIGSARIDENGKISGGSAGDQTGKELSTQNWYKHTKGWMVLRPKEKQKALAIAADMRKACANNNIGYDQNQRNTLYNLAQPLGFDTSKVLVKCETDCSALVRVCCEYAGIVVGDFNTSTQASRLMATGAFDRLTEEKYTKSSAYLKTGDILVTKTKGHTVVVLTDGSNAEKAYALGEREICAGMVGADVKQMQEALISAGYSCGKWGADGDFGSGTLAAVKALQTDAEIEVDGIMSAETLSALEGYLPAHTGEITAKGDLQIFGGDAFIRTGPGTRFAKAGVAHMGDSFTQIKTSGWVPVEISGEVFWISEKYAKEVIA